MAIGGPDIDKHYPGVFRFKTGDKVWVRDRGRNGGYRTVEAVVREQHYHPDRHPWYPYGEGYDLEGKLWWSCYTGCRVFATKEQVRTARMSVSTAEFENRAKAQEAILNEQQHASRERSKDQ